MCELFLSIVQLVPGGKIKSCMLESALRSDYDFHLTLSCRLSHTLIYMMHVSYSRL